MTALLILGSIGLAFIVLGVVLMVIGAVKVAETLDELGF